MLACASDILFRKLVDALDRPDLADDARFRDNPTRVKNKALIESMITDILMTNSQDHWFARLNDAGVPCSPVNSISEVLSHDQTRALAMLQTDPDNPDVTSIGLPLSFGGTRPARHHGAPALGSSDIDDLIKP